jgi:hypothetical protein
MSNLNYKNPLSPLIALGSQTSQRTSTFGTTFSVLNTGGFMEVYTLNDLIYSIPSGSNGDIEFSGNTIPIQFWKGTGSSFSFDTLTLNSDNISSGRRRLGMLVYVYETDQIYQYSIDNYNTLWSNALAASGPGGNTIVISDFGTTVKNNSTEGHRFIDNWTDSTIEGVDGVTRLNARWRKYSSSTDIYVTGGTYFSATSTIDLYRNDGATIPITGFTSGTSGLSGTSGQSGISGLSGSSGISGLSGTSGQSGISGLSGTSGQSGISGLSGLSGSSGISGLSGNSGTSGLSGTSGQSGISGLSGTSGTSGISGLSGLSGTSGTSGISGLSGASGKSGISGLS